MPQTISAQDLHLDLASKSESEIFKWFLACCLFGKRIQQEIARRAWEELIQAGLDSPQRLAAASWQELVDVLGRGHYVRYDESTATRLHELAGKLLHEYDGKMSEVYRRSGNRYDLERRLREFHGVGPKTVEIFMRDMAQIWKFFGTGKQLP